MNKWVILLVVFTGIICVSSGGKTKQQDPVSPITLRFDLGTSHFKKKHYSGPPEEKGTKGEKATQIVGSVSKIRFVGGETQALKDRADEKSISLTFTAKIQNWWWSDGDGIWKKQGPQETNTNIPITGTWQPDGDFVKMTWNTGWNGK